MTGEDKKLLVKDLCGRLPYYVKLWSPVADNNWAILTPVVISNLMNADLSQEQVKPYLRPMSSMTEEERKELKKDEKLIFAVSTNGLVEATQYGFDWLNAHNFDYRGLIEKGLALEAPKDMYKN